MLVDAGDSAYASNRASRCQGLSFILTDEAPTENRAQCGLTWWITSCQT